MTTYAEYFLNSRSSVIEYETVQISHPNFTQTYRIVRNAVAGLTAITEESVSRTFQYYPLKISASGARDNLDCSLTFQLGDLGEVLPLEMDAIDAASGWDTKPTVIYRTFRSDDLTAPLYGPITLEVVDFSFKREGCQFEARAPWLNLVRTGEIYDLDRFPMLRGFL